MSKQELLLQPCFPVSVVILAWEGLCPRSLLDKAKREPRAICVVYGNFRAVYLSSQVYNTIVDDELSIMQYLADR